MCTALKYKNIMGRNFDYETSYGEEFVVVPPYQYDNIYAVMGICTMYTDANGVYPLFYDGINEYGLCMAGLAFEGNAHYADPNNFEEWQGKKGMKVYDFIFKTLGRYNSVKEVESYLENIILTDKRISEKYPNSDMHWLVCDKDGCIIIEQTKDGLNWYPAQTDVLTNNPPYPFQLANYNNEKDYIGCGTYPDKIWSTRGMETDNLKGGYTSEERFIRVSYLKEKLEQSNYSANDIAQAFHLLGSVEQIYGATPVNNSFEYTIYSIAYDMENLCAYIKTYDNLEVHRIALNEVKLSILKRFKI